MAPDFPAGFFEFCSTRILLSVGLAADPVARHIGRADHAGVHVDSGDADVFRAAAQRSAVSLDLRFVWRVHRGARRYACAMEIWTLWHAHYWASGALKGVTAISSVCTAILLVKIVPAALALPRPEELQAANRALETQAMQIREQTRAVESAKSESEWFINSVPSILIGTNHEGKIIRWNFEAVETFGLTESEVVGKTLKNCGVKWVQEQTFTEIDSWTTRKYPHKAANLCFEKQGETRFLGVTIDQLRLADDRAGGLLITGTDITRRLLLEGQLRQAQKLEGIGQLAAGIAHEINTPTQYVGDNVAFIKESWTGLDELLRTVKSIAEQAKKWWAVANRGDRATGARRGEGRSGLSSGRNSAFAEPDTGWSACASQISCTR